MRRAYRNLAERLCPACRRAVRADKGNGRLKRHKDGAGKRCPAGEVP